MPGPVTTKERLARLLARPRDGGWVEAAAALYEDVRCNDEEPMMAASLALELARAARGTARERWARASLQHAHADVGIRAAALSFAAEASASSHPDEARALAQDALPFATGRDLIRVRHVLSRVAHDPAEVVVHLIDALDALRAERSTDMGLQTRMMNSLAMAYEELGRLDDARRAAENTVAVARSGGSLWLATYLQTLGSILFKLQRVADSEACLREAVTHEDPGPARSAARYLLGDMLRRAGRLQAALDCLELGDAPASELELAANLLTQMGRRDEADDLARRAIDEAPDTSRERVQELMARYLLQP